MKKQFEDVLKLIKQQDVDGCITGSYMLGFNKNWNQDIDVFLYDEHSFRKLLFFMHHHPSFIILDELEKHKLQDYIDGGKSTLKNIGLITIKFLYNTCVPINITYKEYQRNIFSVLANFDLDLICVGYDIKTKNVLNLRTSVGKKGTWNTWNVGFYKNDVWSIKRLLRQFTRVVKYTERGYDLTAVTNKYIQLVKEKLKMENIYKSERGTKFHEDTQQQLEIVLKILQTWKKTQKITKEELLVLQTLI